MNEDINKLPKWAQYKIKALENKVDENKKLSDTSTPTRVAYASYGEQIVYLRDDRGVVFSLPSGEVEVRIKREQLEIYSYSGSISIHPQVSNVISVEVEKR